MFELIFHLPEQIETAIKIARRARVTAREINNLVVCGMGGSGIGGELLLGIFGQEIKVPVHISKDYELPRYIGKDTLIILVSYSGNTEETLANYDLAREQGCVTAVLSSGGKLVARKGRSSKVIIPPGLPPRAAIGYLFTPLPFLLWRYGLIKNPQRSITGLVRLLKERRTAIMPKASKIARWLKNALPLIYSNSQAYNPVAYRWRCQLNENSKIFAHSHSIPEMNHNEIVGIGGICKVAAMTKIIFLDDPEGHIRNKKRVRITQDLIGKHTAGMIRLEGEGKSRLERAFYLIWLGDFVSYYLAQLRRVEPLPVKRIDALKARL